jgi:hypothetical protein
VFNLPNLTADGLHLVVYSGTPGGTSTQFFASRASLDERFGQPLPIDAFPVNVPWGWMTENCGRMYLSGLSSIFYLAQH